MWWHDSSQPWSMSVGELTSRNPSRKIFVKVCMFLLVITISDVVVEIACYTAEYIHLLAKRTTFLRLLVSLVSLEEEFGRNPTLVQQQLYKQCHHWNQPWFLTRILNPACRVEARFYEQVTWVLMLRSAWNTSYLICFVLSQLLHIQVKW